MWVPVAVWQPCELLYACYFTYLLICLSGARCRLFAYGPADATASLNPINSCLIQIQNGFPFLVPAYPDCPGKEAVKWVCVLSKCKQLHEWRRSLGRHITAATDRMLKNFFLHLPVKWDNRSEMWFKTLCTLSIRVKYETLVSATDCITASRYLWSCEVVSSAQQQVCECEAMWWLQPLLQRWLTAATSTPNQPM